MHGRRIWALAGTASVAAVLAAAGIASAQGETVKINSQISIKEPQSLHFKGKVTADNANCVESRKVVLYAVASGGSPDKVGSAQTDSKGRWAVEVQGSAGITLHSFFAKVKKQSQGTAGTIYVCKGAKSETLPPETM